MQPEPRSFTDAWREWAVPGEIIQIRQESSVLFRPRVSTHPFWLYLGAGEASGMKAGPTSLVIQSAVFNCRRLFPRRGEEIKVPILDFHEDEMEKEVSVMLPVLSILTAGEVTVSVVNESCSSYWTFELVWA